MRKTRINVCLKSIVVRTPLTKMSVKSIVKAFAAVPSDMLLARCLIFAFIVHAVVDF